MAKKKKDEIKKMEEANREKSISNASSVEVIKEVVKQQPQKVSFDSWYFLRSKKIPSAHSKEILTADFKARGLKNEETMQSFDNALYKYGVRL